MMWVEVMMAGALLDDLVGRVKQRLAGEALRELPDDLLLDRYWRGDQDAFTVLVERHAPLVLSVCRRLLGPGPDAEDAFQATFLILARRAGTVRWEACIRGWLYRVALQVARRARQRAERERRLQQAAARPEGASANDPTWQEGLARLDEELAALPANYRDVLLACCLEGRSRDEAGRELGLSPGQVKGLLERARELLRARLARRGVVIPAALLLLLLQPGSAPAATPLLAATVHASLAFAAGQGQGVAPSVLTLAQGVLSAMSLMKSLWAAALTLVATLAVAVGVWASTGPGETPVAAPVVLAEIETETEPVVLQEKKLTPILQGTLAAVDAAKNTVTIDIPPQKDKLVGEIPGAKVTLPLTADATITLAGKPVKLGDIKIGETLLLKLTEDRKSVVAVIAGAVPEKKIPEVHGKLTAVDAEKNTVTLEVTIKTKTGEVSTEKTAFPLAADATITAHGKPVKLGDLKIGEPAIARLSEDKKSIVNLVVAPEVKKVQPEVHGTLSAIAVMGNTVTIEITVKTKTGEVSTEKLTLAPDAAITLNGKPVKVGDLKPGEQAVAKLTEDKKSVVALAVGEVKKVAVLKGKIKAVDAEKLTVTLTMPGKGGGEIEKTLPVAKDAKVTIQGKPAELKDVKAGEVASAKLTAEQDAIAELIVE
jgi:RNA polymerase sigma factor (sigma-70 family)